ncbi:MAG: hypothetical protein ACFFD2_00235 [Promethearchaeota archaeon]
MASESTSENKITSEHKNFRRVICCKILKDNLDKFLQVFKEDEWKKIKIFGKRGAKYSYLKKRPNKTRFHMRLYEIDEYFYFLIHYEPTLNGDISFHILGLFDRFKSKKENVLSSEKLELANYQTGIDYFKNEMIKKYEILKEICDYEIDEDEVKYFAMKFGYISLKLPVEILIEELSDAIISENLYEFYSILKKLFITQEFQPIETNSSNFLIIESPLLKNFRCLLQKINLIGFDLQALEKKIKDYNITTTVLIPRTQDNISATLSQKLEDLNINIIEPMNFLKIFNIYKNFPIYPERFQQLFKGGLITADFIESTLEPVDFTGLLNKSMELFAYLKEQTAWTSLETLKYEFVKQHNFNKFELKSILNFLTYPLINLILVKKKKRRFRKDREFYRAIKNFDEIQFRLKNIKKFLSKIT